MTVTANEAINVAHGKSQTKDAQHEAEDFLMGYLEDRPMPAERVKEAAEANFIAERTLRRAAKRLGVIIEKISFEGGWTWRLPSTGMCGG